MAKMNLTGKLLAFSARGFHVAAKKRRKVFCSAILVAAGASRRMGRDKLLLELEGKPVLVYALQALEASDKVTEIIVVTSAELLPKVTAICSMLDSEKLKAVVKGGETRMESVKCGLSQVSKEAELIAIHDAARPFADAAFISEVIEKAKDCAGAVPVLPVTDTIKVVEGGNIVSTPRRSTLFAAQTPQVFDADLYRAAVETLKGDEEITDDSMVMEAMGAGVSVTDGRAYNIKLTRPEDLTRAKQIMEERKKEQ